jgi:hypothetical protein
MHPPAHIDGCNLVILRQTGGSLRWTFEVVESGWLHFDGDTLTLDSDRGAPPRAVSEAEQEQILTVSEKNGIPHCAGYRLFILQAKH